MLWVGFPVYVSSVLSIFTTFILYGNAYYSNVTFFPLPFSDDAHIENILEPHRI